MADVTLEHLGGVETRGCLGQVQGVYAIAFPDDDLGEHESRTLRQVESSGFQAVTARLGEELVGFAYGLPLSASSQWWRGLEPSPSAGFVAETGERTFAVIDLAVLPAHRGHGLGRRLMDELLGSRREERATLATNPNDRQVQRMYERWGWHRVGRCPGGEGETQPEFDLYVIALR